LEDEPHDCTPDGLCQFLRSSSARAQELGWDDDAGGIPMVPKDINDPTGEAENLLDNCESVNLSKIRAFEEQHLDSEIRPAQDSCMTWKCLMSSVSVAGKNKITIWWRDQQHNVQNRASGNLLLKIIIRESHLDTNRLPVTFVPSWLPWTSTSSPLDVTSPSSTGA
jgi:hypothetical protein